jgi:DNA-binding transcriptional MocR family regulator
VPWAPELTAGSSPLYAALADRLEADIAGGSLLPGERLPTQRALAQRLGIDLTTVNRAFAEAASRGLIVSEGRRGSFVRARSGPVAADLAGADVASGMNMPPEPEDGSLRERIQSGLIALLQQPNAPLHYQPPGGAEAYRASFAAYLSRSIPGTGADQMVITAGSQHAIHAILSLHPPSLVATGCFTYPGFLSAARRAGAEIVGLAMDEQGILPDAFEAAARRSKIDLLYCVPTNDNPTTATMGAERRRALAGLAHRFGITIVEDDAYGALREAPLPPIASFAPELSWHIVTLSKLVSPALRVGFVRAPGVRESFALAGAAHESAIMAPPLNLALVARWLDDGSLARLIGSVRAEAAARMRDAAPLFGVAARWQAEGYHLWLPLAEGASAGDLAAQAIAAGLPAVPSSTFAVDPGQAIQALRISLGGSASRSRVAREVRRMEAMLGRPARALV